MNHLTIYYFGNEYIPEDALAVEVVKTLKERFPKATFVHIKSTFELMETELEGALIIDVADSVPRVVQLAPGQIKTRNLASTHDFDLGFYLSLTGKKATIIALPLNYPREQAIAETAALLRQFHANQLRESESNTKSTGHTNE